MAASVLESQTYQQWQASTRMTIDDNFRRFVEFELLPAVNVDAAEFWSGLEHLIDELTPENRELLARRDRLQHQLDAWHK